MAKLQTLPKDLAAFCDLVAGIQTNTPSWELERNNSLGCSELSAVVGVNPWADRHTVWLSKTKNVQQPHKWQFDIGHALEPVVRGIFEEQTGVTVSEMGMVRSKEFPWLHYTPDGLTADGGLFEAKTTSWWMREEWSDEQVADHAEVQVQGGMAVTGRSHAWVAAMIDANPDRVEIRRVERDDAFIDQMLTVAQHFWFNYVVAGVEPPLSSASLGWVKDTFSDPDENEVADIGDEGYHLVKQHQAAKAAERAAKKMAEETQAQLRQMIGNAGVITANGSEIGTLRKVITRRVSQEQMIVAGLNPDDYKTESESTRLTWKKGI